MAELDIARRRLLNQHIALPAAGKPDDAVGWLVASQAQDYAGARWALGLRLQGATEDDIEQAFTEGSILRTHVLRPTWHFVTPADIRWLLALTAPRVHAVNAFMYRKFELDDAIFARSNAALAKALQGGKQLTREELRAVLLQAGITAEEGLRLGLLVMRAELDGVICSGARRGKQFTYALLDERAPQARILQRDEALAEFAGRYFMSRGPATVQDLAKWSGLTVADAGRGLEMVKSQLQHELLDGQAYWFPPSASFPTIASPKAYLLSIFDEYMSAYKDRSAIGSREHGEKLVAMGNDLTYVVVIDGQILGTWKRTLKKNLVMVRTSMFVALAEAQKKAVAVAADAYGAFLGLPVELTQA